MLRISDLVTLDTKGQFRSDVQLSDFDDPSLNLALLQSYIFSTTTPDSYKGAAKAIASLNLLGEITRAYTYYQFPNRLIAIANYGHGKSHLGLVLANYFSRPADSPEVEAIVRRIDYAADSGQTAHYRDFKRERGEFLVLRLRGDQPRSLREQFFLALKQALSEHERTKKVQLPFWFKAALQFLRGLSEEALSRANTYLEQYHTDVEALIQEVEEYHDESYRQYVDLFAHLNSGVVPSYDGNVSLSEAIRWIVTEFCEEQEGFGGVLILFDEFSQYVLRYARGRSVGELQDLLQGVEDHSTKVVFLAFGQHDPLEVANQTAQNGQALQNLKKELSRLPDKGKYSLYSLMESVLDAYLKQDTTAWEQFLGERDIRRKVLIDATQIAWDAFNRYYDRELGWTIEKFRKTVTEGCFPLHPLTTGILCQIKVQQGEDIGVARTVLGFINVQLERRANMPALVDGHVNWILPIDLVDYFEHRLVDSLALRNAYEKAVSEVQQILSNKNTDAHLAALKALLLQQAVGLPATKDTQALLLAELSGIDERQMRVVLVDLRENSITRYDNMRQLHSFWPVGTDPRKLAQYIRDAKSKLQLESDVFLRELNRYYRSSDLEFGRVPVEVQWGHSSDWAAEEYIVTPSQLAKEYFLELFQPFRYGQKGLEEGLRGLVLWVLAREGEFHRDELREKARAALNEAWPTEAPPPVVVVIPRKPNDEMIELFLERLALEQLGRDTDKKSEVGQSTYDAEIQRNRQGLRDALKNLRGSADNVWTVRREFEDMAVPAPLQSTIVASVGLSLRRVLQQQYEGVYRHRPPEFFRQFSGLTAPKLRSAVKAVLPNLLRDRVGSAYSGMDPVARSLCDDFLASKWGILARGVEHGQDYFVQKPSSLALEPAWNLLEKSFAPGVEEVAVNPIITAFLNPPYGFDYNTAALFLCAWIGHYQSELRFSVKGAVANLTQLEQWAEAKSSKEFLNRLYDNMLLISRRTPDALQQEVRALARRVQTRQVFEQSEAAEALVTLAEFTEHGKQPAEETRMATETVEELRNALELAREYDKEVVDIQKQLSTERDINRLLDLRQKLRRLNAPDLVSVTQPPTSDLIAQVDEYLQSAIERECQQVNTLQDITRVSAIRERLQNISTQLQQHGFLQLVERVGTAQSTLDERVRILEIQASEETLRNEIRAMSCEAGLAQLHKYTDRLTKIQGGSDILERERTEKLKAIQQEIQQLEEFAKGLDDEIASLELGRSEELRLRIIRRQDRYVETEVEKRLRNALDRLQILNKFSVALSILAQKHPASPEDVQNIDDQLQALARQYSPNLGDTHLGELARVRKKLQIEADQLRQEAVQWLEALEADFRSNARPSDLKHKLDNPPTFLPSEFYGRLEKLQGEWQERVANDIIGQIEALFLSLNEPRDREACLQRLQEISAVKTTSEGH